MFSASADVLDLESSFELDDVMPDSLPEPVSIQTTVTSSPNEQNISENNLTEDVSVDEIQNSEYQLSFTDNNPKINEKPNINVVNFRQISPLVGIQQDSLEGEFFCIIQSVNIQEETILADVYDINDTSLIMQISAKFSEFIPSDRDKIEEGASFYWRFGSRVKKTPNKKGLYKPNVTNFSEFRMRLNYVSPRSLEGRLESYLEKYSNIFI